NTNREFDRFGFARCSGDCELCQVTSSQQRQTNCKISTFHDFDSPLLFSFEVASEDATLVVVVVQLCASDCAPGVQSPVNFGRQEHSEGRRDKINPKRHPNPCPNRGT